MVDVQLGECPGSRVTHPHARTRENQVEVKPAALLVG